MQPEIKQTNEQYLPRFKIVVGLQVFLGVGLLACGVLGAILSEEYIGFMTYYVGGFTMGLAVLFCSFLNGRIAYKISNPISADFTPTANTAVYGSPMAIRLFVAFIIMTSLVVPVSIFSVVICGVFGVTYGDNIDGYDYDDGDEEEPANKAENRKIAYSIIAACVVGMAIIIYNCVIIMNYKKDITQIINPGLITGQNRLAILGNMELYQGTPSQRLNQTNSQYGVQNQHVQQTEYSVGYLHPHPAPNQQNFVNPSAPPLH